MFDMVVHHEGMSVVVEADGPSHYTQSVPYRLLGGTVVRNRWFALLGFRVVCVPGHVWINMKGSEEKQQYLQKALDDAIKQQGTTVSLSAPKGLLPAAAAAASSA